MKYIICYDIANNRRRNRVSKTLAGYGERIHESVFESELNPRKFLYLRRALGKCICPVSDKLFIYPLCERDRPDIVHLGISSKRAQLDAFIV